MKILYSLIYIAVLGVLSHFMGQALPRDSFDPERFPYRTFAWEKGGKVYEKLGIKRWKDILPDMSRVMPDMIKKKLTGTDKAKRMDELIAETCAAECVHWALILLSFVLLLWWRGIWAWAFLLVYNLLGNLPFIIIQRYNRPRLLRCQKRRAKNQ